VKGKKLGRLPSRGFFGLAAIAFPKLLDSPGGVYELLLSGVERVALGADFHADVALVRRSGPENAPAGAMDRDHVIFGMDSFFHADARTFLLKAQQSLV
jgi:hypothetical protein